MKLNTVVVAIAIAVLSGASLHAVELTGAGATFPYPLYSKMFDAYHKSTGHKVNFQAIGSGGGIRQLKVKTVDFGATDAYISDKDILHIPICAGGVALSYNLPGNPSLKFSPDVLADIWLGNIKKWNDKRLIALNPEIRLPKMRIAVCQRSDGSGTTYIFTDYLSKVSDVWMKKVGKGKAVNWPVGLGGKGNAGVAGLIDVIPGAIGYVGSTYALQNKLPMAAIQNKRGVFVTPTIEAISMAADTPLPADTKINLTDTASRHGYPISGFTWILLYEEQAYKKRTLVQAKETINLIRWMITEGQRYARILHYAPLPETAVTRAKAVLAKVAYHGESL